MFLVEMKAWTLEEDIIDLSLSEYGQKISEKKLHRSSHKRRDIETDEKGEDSFEHHKHYLGHEQQTLSLAAKSNERDKSGEDE